MARTLGFEPRPAVLETDMLPITPSPHGGDGWTRTIDLTLDSKMLFIDYFSHHPF